MKNKALDFPNCCAHKSPANIPRVSVRICSQGRKGHSPPSGKAGGHLVKGPRGEGRSLINASGQTPAGASLDRGQRMGAAYVPGTVHRVPLSKGFL